MRRQGKDGGIFANLRKRVGRAALAVDSFVDSWFFESSRRTRDNFASFAAFMDRFHVSGLKKLGVERTE